MTSDAVRPQTHTPPVNEPSLPPSERPSRRDAHFRTDDLIDDLGKRSISSGRVAVISSAASFIIQFGTLAVLGRLLTQQDFGIVSMVTAFNAFITTFRDLGLGQASIQSDETDHSNTSTLFWLNGTTSLLAGGLLVAIGPLLSSFYEQPGLTPVAAAIGLSLALSGLSSQHIALLQRRFRHGTVAIVRISAQLGASLVAIAMALNGAGYWALVALSLGQSAFTLVAAWIACDWRPGRPKWSASTKTMLAFSLPLVGSELLATAMRNTDLILINKLIGPAQAGIYLMAYRLLLMPIRQINSPLASVALPTFSRLKDDAARFRRMYRKAISGICLAGMPLIGGAFATAPALIPLVIGPKWVDSILVFLALGPAALLATFNVAGSWSATPCGFTGRLLKWGLIGPPLTIVAYTVGAYLGGIVGVALAFSIAQIVLRPFALGYILKPTPVGLGDVLAASVAPMLATCLGAAAGLFVTTSIDLTSPLGQALGVLAGGATFTALFATVILLMPSAKPHRELVHQIAAPALARMLRKLTAKDSGQ